MELERSIVSAYLFRNEPDRQVIRELIFSGARITYLRPENQIDYMQVYAESQAFCMAKIFHSRKLIPKGKSQLRKIPNPVCNYILKTYF